MKLQLSAIPFALLISSISLSAQTTTAIKLPSQLATAKTIFVAFAGAPIGIDSDKDIPVTKLVITGVQDSLSKSGRYTQVDKPGDAELSARLSVESGIGIRLAIFDTRTGTLLWTIDEPVQWGARKETILKNIKDGTARLIADLDALASGTIGSGSSTAVTQHRPKESNK